MGVTQSICVRFLGSMDSLLFNLIHHIFRCMQMNSRYEAGIVVLNFNIWMEEQSFENVDSFLTKNP